MKYAEAQERVFRGRYCVNRGTGQEGTATRPTTAASTRETSRNRSMQTQMALFLGLVLLGGGQPEQDSSPSDRPAPVAEQAEAPAPADASCCEPSCCDSCGRGCGHESVCCWMIREMCLGPLFHGDCNMVPHSAYYPELHGYYYFRPYHYSHIRQHQEFVSSFGEDPRAPYANGIFQQVYRQMSGSPKSSLRPFRIPQAAKSPRSQTQSQAAIQQVSHRRVVAPAKPRTPRRSPILSRRK